MFDFFKKIKNLAVVTLSENLNWLVEKRPELQNIEKIAVLTAPDSQRLMKRNYKGADIFFKYLDEVKEVADICDCAMFIDVSKDLTESYLKIAKVSNNLTHIIVPSGYMPTDKVVAKGEVNGANYDVVSVPVIVFKSTEKKFDIQAPTVPTSNPKPKEEKEIKNEVPAMNMPVETPVKRGRMKK